MWSPFGAIIFGLVGAFVKWVLKGFKPRFKDVWHGPKYDNPADSAAYEMSNNILGAVVLFLICLMIIKAGC